jgi:uncharacterized cupin superfamily protein
VTRPDGSSEVFSAGDTFFIAQGTKSAWEITEKLRAVFMMASQP